MKRRVCLAASATLAAPWCIRSLAQLKARRVGVLLPWPDAGPNPVVAEAWKKLGWIEGQNVLIERKYANWRADSMPELIDALLRRFDAELLAVTGSFAAVAAARATRTVPVVFSQAFLPIESGLIDSYARPGRNLTGTAMFSGVEAVHKRVQLLHEVVPSMHRFALLTADSTLLTISGAPLPDTFAATAKANGIEYTTHVARNVDDVQAALAAAAATRPQGVHVTGEPYEGAATPIAEFALRQRWVSATFNGDLFDAGLLMYYGTSGEEWVRHVLDRPLRIVDRILRGGNPADIPVELPARFETAINLKVARALGLTIPRPVLLRADRVIS